MRRFIILLVLLSLLSQTARADEPAVVPIPPGDDKIEPIKKGDPAPFSGQLYDPATALRWANFLQQYKLRLKEDAVLNEKIRAAELAYHEKLLAIEREKYVVVVKDLEGKNAALRKEAFDPPFYRSVWFGVVIGALAMGTAVGLAAWGLTATK